MKVACRLRRERYAAVVAILLVVAVLGAGIADCDGARTYQVTISSGSGGNVTTPGEGTFTYDTGTVIPLIAAPDDGYQFRSWTGDISFIGNANAASTTITMNANCAIVANFGTEAENGHHEQ